MMVDSNIDDCNAVAHTGGWSLVSLGHTPWFFSPFSLIGISRHFPQVDKSNPDILQVNARFRYFNHPFLRSKNQYFESPFWKGIYHLLQHRAGAQAAIFQLDGCHSNLYCALGSQVGTYGSNFR